MLRYAADENFNNDIVRIQDAGLIRADDPTVLAWAAAEGRILLTHDVKTITRFAYERVSAGQAMPGVVEVSQSLPLGPVIEDLLLLAEASAADEWQGQILYLPLQP